MEGRQPRGLTRRLVAASGLLAAIVGGAFVVMLLAIDDLREAERRTTHSQRVLIAANELERLLLDLETGQRGFVLTGQERFLQPWRAAREAFPRRAAVLVRLVAADRAARLRAQRIVRAERAYISNYSVPLITSARRGDPSARTTSATAAGKRRVDAMRVEFDRLLGAQGRVSAAASASTDRAARRASAATAVGLAGSIAIIALYAGYVARTIARPIRRAAMMAGRLAGGDLSARVPETGPAEVGVLERTFNVMAGSLEQSRDELAGLADEQAALRRVATLVARAAPPPAVFAAVAQEVGRLLGGDCTRLYRYDGDDEMTIVSSWNAGDTEDVVGGHVAAPITVEGRVWGEIVVASASDAAPPPETEERLGGFAELVATAIANAESRAELTASRARVVATADETRRRIERDLHDGTQQRLVSLALQLRAAQAVVPQQLAELDEELEDVATGITEVLDELREMARGIHPAILAQGGLGPALKTLARRSPVPVELDVRVALRLPEAVEVGAYYVVSEALANVAKHARASSAAVEVAVADSVLRIHVRDDGVGGAAFAGGSGLVGLKDRVDALGGRIDVDSAPGAGTSLHVELPISGKG